MELAKLSSKGQITLPIAVRQALRLRSGGKVAIQEENGRYYFDNASFLAFSRIERSFEGEAEKAGFSTEAEMQEYMKKIPKEVRGY